MNKFPNLTEEEIDAILDYISVENLKPKALIVPTASVTTSILYNSSK